MHFPQAAGCRLNADPAYVPISDGSHDARLCNESSCGLPTTRPCRIHSWTWERSLVFAPSQQIVRILTHAVSKRPKVEMPRPFCHAPCPCMRLTEAFQCAGRTFAALSSEVEERESPPRRFFPGLAAGSLFRPAARGTAPAPVCPPARARPPHTCCPAQPVQIIRHPSIQYSSFGGANGRTRSGRTRGRTRLAGKLCDTWWNCCNTLLVPRFCDISHITSHLVLVNFSQRFEVSSVFNCMLVFFGKR